MYDLYSVHFGFKLKETGEHCVWDPKLLQSWYHKISQQFSMSWTKNYIVNAKAALVVGTEWEYERAVS